MLADQFEFSRQNKTNKQTKQNYTTLRTILNYSIFFSLCLSLCISLCLSISLSVSLYLFLSFCLSVSLSLCLSVSLSVSIAYLSFESWCAILNAWIAWNLLNKLKFDKQLFVSYFCFIMSDTRITYNPPDPTVYCGLYYDCNCQIGIAIVIQSRK